MKSKITFLYNGEPVEIDFQKEGLSPTTTLLNWSRNNGHKEVKEGCAEGDCGACTIVIAEADAKEKLHYKAVNSCILFLPVLDGKMVISAAGLVTETHILSDLHPVQKAIVEDRSSNDKPLSKRFFTTFAPPKSRATRASILTSTISPGLTNSFPL